MGPWEVCWVLFASFLSPLELLSLSQGPGVDETLLVRENL